jgi:hypothetical protein
MPFPNAEHAAVDAEKVRDYLLNPSHPVGGSKAIWFASIGYTLDNWQELADDLVQLARTSGDFVAKPSAFGVKYEVSGEIGRSRHGSAVVISVWIAEEGHSPRLVTAYPG